jgi:hypothetical protein
MQPKPDDLQLSPEEAARALAAIQNSRNAMRAAIRAHRGHYHLWLWGVIWIGMAMLAEFRGLAGVHLMPWLCAAGITGSMVLGFVQGSQIRMPVDKRFLGVLAAVILFSALWPLVLRAPVNDQAIFAYSGLVAMLCYVIAGLWFDTYLLWLGLVMTAFILVGLFCFAAIFWWWIAIFGGGTLIVSGFYIRYFWR